MTESTRFGAQWWAWWSNPIRSMHPENQAVLPLTAMQIQKMDYFQLLQLRSVLALPDMPDTNLEAKPELRSLALASREQIETCFMKWAVWGMDSSILHARAQDWQANYGVTSPDTIREIVTLRNEMPREIYVWHDTFANQLKTLNSKAILISDRTLLSVAIYLKSFFPGFYLRWKLTVPLEISTLTAKLESIPLELWDHMELLTAKDISALHAQVYQPFADEDFEMPGLGDMPELEEFQDRVMSSDEAKHA